MVDEQQGTGNRQQVKSNRELGTEKLQIKIRPIIMTRNLAMLIMMIMRLLKPAGETKDKRMTDDYLNNSDIFYTIINTCMHCI